MEVIHHGVRHHDGLNVLRLNVLTAVGRVRSVNLTDAGMAKQNRISTHFPEKIAFFIKS
jgi:hypothetical protein